MIGIVDRLHKAQTPERPPITFKNAALNVVFTARLFMEIVKVYLGEG